MDVAWQALIANFSIFTVIILTWTFAQSWLETRPRAYRRYVFTAMMAAGIVVTMSVSAQLSAGVFFDLRAAFLVIAAFFGGPITAVIVTVVAIAYRAMFGGQSVWVGVAGILLYSLLGLWAHRSTQWHDPQKRTLGLVSLGALTIGLSLTALFAPGDRIAALLFFGLPSGILNSLATLGGGLVILQAGLVRNERHLLRSAITQAPDFFYVKNRSSHLIAVNQTVATYNGFARPEDMKGKSDYDLFSEDRADESFAAEQDLMRSKIPQVEIEERLLGPDGAEHWFVTSKVPLHDQEGAIVGLVGVTRDVTERRRLDAALKESRNLLSRALAEMSDGLAMFDKNGVLVFCNERYRRSFPQTGEARQAGAHLRDILRLVVETGEQVGVTRENGDAWIEGILTTLHTGGEEEVALFDGQWLHVRTRPADDGSSFVVVSDATKIKSAETSLRKLTQQLRTLATTDGLTGLMNRRAFDAALDNEWLRASRSTKPLSLLMIDVDKFKTYNDLYGHQAGDECLRQVGRALQGLVKRAGDIAARYGGEEFVVVLPETDEDGAFFIAESIRQAIRDLAIAHTGVKRGVVTISIGLATSEGSTNLGAATDLIARADKALYTAKSAGRDRVTGWRDTASLESGRAAS
jgi:diguanylate cyclase (GGDEF)-like protein/PAS domain S-box-containing protein